MNEWIHAHSWAIVTFTRIQSTSRKLSRASLQSVGPSRLQVTTHVPSRATVFICQVWIPPQENHVWQALFWVHLSFAQQGSSEVLGACVHLNVVPFTVNMAWIAYHSRGHERWAAPLPAAVNSVSEAFKDAGCLFPWVNLWEWGDCVV